MRQQQSIHAAFDKQLNQDKHRYEIRLAASIRVVRLLVTQGLTFRGHDESKASLNRVATASVERAFSAMKFIKNELRSRMNDEFLSGCMIPFGEKDVFNDVSTDDIILTFQAMKPRRVVL
ncbi:uncharacterized protein LOC132642404 [Lycium barbarum]|uniref:uncharacterized protein LOC132642404 n=1 Tax=Lycium barbarum TaxID=112863 RepID=UPI00293E0D04|nr:uncharacterized protein LOC132642404 [Lycium barbarum]